MLSLNLKPGTLDPKQQHVDSEPEDRTTKLQLQDLSKPLASEV